MYKIGVYGSSAGDLEKIIPKAREVGQVLGKKKLTVITGACSGLPYEAAREAKKIGSVIWGYSQAVDMEDQETKVTSHPASFYNQLFLFQKIFHFYLSLLSDFS